MAGVMFRISQGISQSSLEKRDALEMADLYWREFEIEEGYRFN